MIGDLQSGKENARGTKFNSHPTASGISDDAKIGLSFGSYPWSFRLEQRESYPVLAQ